MVSVDLMERFSKKDHLFSLLMIIGLVLTIFSAQNIIFIGPDQFAIAETGAPPDNGTTSQTWHIEANDRIIRTHESISTNEIVVNDLGTMDWFNVTAIIKDNVEVNSQGIFNLSASSIDLTGMLNVNGTMTWENVDAEITGDLNSKTGSQVTIINSTILMNGNLVVKGAMVLVNTSLIMNCSSSGEYYLSAENGGKVTIESNSSIRSPAKERSIRIFYISSNSWLQANDSEFQYFGVSSKFTGIKSESNDTYFSNCTFSSSLTGVALIGSFGATISGCRFINNSVGIDLNSSKDALIRDTMFRFNEVGVQLQDASGNRLVNLSLSNNSKYSIFLIENSVENRIYNSIFSDNLGSGIRMEDGSSNNIVFNCTLRNNSGTGIECYYNSKGNQIRNTTLVNSGNNVNCTNNSTIMILNSTLLGSAGLELSLSDSSEIVTLNTTFNKSSVFVGVGSNLTIQWFLHVYVQNTTNASLPGTNVTFWEKDNDDYIMNTTTDASSWIKWVILTEYYRTTAGITNLTPHRIITDRFGFGANTTIINLTSTKIIIITLEEVLLFAPDLAPVTLESSSDHPLNGEMITVEGRIENIGYLNFNSSLTNVTVGFYIDNQLINFTTNLSSIPIHGETDINITWQVNTTNGSHELKMLINSDLNLTEVGYENNNMTKTLIVNSIPIAVLNATPDEVRTYEDVLFNANNSYKEVIEIELVQYFFDFGDGNTSGWLNNPITYYSYTDNDVYNARVRVQDAAGVASNWSDVIKVNVLNRPPRANISIDPSLGKVSTEFWFSAEESVDLDGIVSKFQWNFSDGFSSTDRKVKHSFSDDIEYTIYLQVWDDDSEVSARINRTFKIQNTQPTAFFNASKVIANISELITFDASATMDIDDEFAVLEFFWDFDDNSFGFNQTIIQHHFTTVGVYNVSLFVKDDDGNTGIYRLEINITEPNEITPVDDDEPVLFWAIVTIVIILTIFFILIMLAFITQNRKLHKLTGGADTEHEVPEFTTAGKLDFVILKRSFGNSYMKFELHQTTKSPAEYLGLIWKTGLLNKSWQIVEHIVNTKDKVVDQLQLRVLAYNSRNWVVDYGGNGIILSKGFKSKPGEPITVSKSEENTAKSEPPIELDQKKEKEADSKTSDFDYDDDEYEFIPDDDNESEVSPDVHKDEPEPEEDI